MARLLPALRWVALAIAWWKPASARDATSRGYLALGVEWETGFSQAVSWPA